MTDLSQYRCETCKNESCRLWIGKHADYSFKIIKDYDLNPHDKCEDISEFVQGINQVGCASHSDFKKPIDVLKEAISIWWKCYSPVPRSRYAKKSYQKNGERVELKSYHHHHIKRSIFMKYWEMTDMATTQDGLIYLTEFIKKFKPNDVDSNHILKRELVNNIKKRNVNYGDKEKENGKC